ncbi:toll/interleukin-1 receptor domain-containing protein [Thiothrix nivea]|uniref:TIR domain-containing protein n=1 Tax=Thiothrix nivea (strain ATCC 35100 / DSM 5205 / JP2) TaxID=870187 RepID=A0A656HK36_THINJ|nr:toll/interleukin-1 receptor domain-containing protein [Thiothrix nivea]EIJ36592.1 hypothetical protein Thini_4100 [Thiothrix nivea DSM 5205]
MSDIFVSYARINDQPFSGQKQGWVSHFINNLRNETSQRIGRAENYSLWMDFKLSANDAVTPEIEKQLRDAHILIVMMSRGWLESEWCVRELEYFCATHDDLAGRIFIINQDGLPREEQPEILHDLVSCPLYEKTPHDQIQRLGYPVPDVADREYFGRIVELSFQLEKSLRRFAQALVLKSAEPRSVETKATAYVAPVHDSLFDQRSQLVSELAQFGIQALPAANRFDREFESNLQRCSHFVQLLDTDFVQGLSCDQYLIAQTMEKPVLQWRDPMLDCSKANHEQKALLEGKTVIACELPDFIRQVREEVLPKPPPPPPPVNGNKMVFVHASPEDFPKAEQVAATLQERGFGIVLPRYEGDAQRIRKSIERGYQYCDVLLMLQQRASADLVEDYLAELEVYAKKSPTVLLCQCQRAEKLHFIPPLMKILHCNDRFEADCLEQFLATEVSA